MLLMVPGETETLESIANAELPEATRLLLNLPPPPQSFDEATEDQQKAAGKRALSLAQRLLVTEWDSSEWKAIMASADHPSNCSPCVFGELLRSLVAYHFRLTVGLLNQRRGPVDDVAFIRIPSVEKILETVRAVPDDQQEATEERVTRSNAATFLAEYGMFVVGWMMTNATVTPAWSPFLVMESLVHSNLSGLAHSLSTKGVSRAANWLVPEATKLLADVYKDREGAEHPDHRPGVFSAIRPGELALLASRDEAIGRRYATTALERVFEQQLALLFQSFGFLVVQTRVGTSTVDLVCVADQAGGSATILVEAKTSRRAYPLPTKDSRALRDYAADVEAQLRSLPPLRLVLMVGPDPAPTIGPKLRQLETRIRLPVRYMPAAVASAVREALPGPVVPYGFIEAVVASDAVLDLELPEGLSQRYRRIQETHQQFTHGLHDAWA